MQEKITVKITVNASIVSVWSCWTEPSHITQWVFASDDWHAPYAENDLKIGGKFLTRMEAKDGSAGFDFNGVYTEVILNEKISYMLEGGRRVVITFIEDGGAVIATETFDPENENSREMQRFGWQSILDNFKKYVESN